MSQQVSPLDEILHPIKVDGQDYMIVDKQQIKKLMLEIVGEDERLEHLNDMDNVLAAAQNALRAELRAKAKQYFKGSLE
jgi:hypothetical protein